MKSLSITVKDVRLLFKDPGTWIYLLVLPVIFIFIFAGGLSALAGEDEPGPTEVARLALPVVNLDPDGALATLLLERLETVGNVTVQTLAAAEAQAQLEGGDIVHLLTIPAGFSADFAAGIPVTLRIVNHPEASARAGDALELAVDSAAQDLALESQILASLEHIGAMQAEGTPAQDAFSAERGVAQAKKQFAAAQDVPLIALERVDPGQTLRTESGPRFTDVQIKVPGLMVLFVFLVAQATARSIYDEKRVGSFRRLLAAPMSRGTLLAGKILPNFVVALTQMAVIFLAAVYLFPLLGLEQLALGHDPLALGLLCLALALCSTCLGILIATLARTENQIGGLSTMLIWGTGFLGGALMPAFLMSDVLDRIARIVPQYWAIGGFYDLLVLGGGLADIVPSLLALLGFSALFAAVGLWRFDFH